MSIKLIVEKKHLFDFDISIVSIIQIKRYTICKIIIISKTKKSQNSKMGLD